MLATHEDVRPIEILLVEDSPGDIRLTQEALCDAKICNNLHVAMDGDEAMRFLRQEDEFSGAPLPDLILLDLNLPRKDGRDVLQEVKTNDRWKRIPIVVLTTSSAERDIVASYNLYANCYITKPVDLEKFIGVVREIEDFWLSLVKLPRSRAGQA